MGLTADDRFAILDLLSRCNWAIDAGRSPDNPPGAADSWAQTFTEDSRFTVERADATESVEMRLSVETPTSVPSPARSDNAPGRVPLGHQRHHRRRRHPGR